MREILMEWIMNIVVFALITSVAMKLLPGKAYLPYMRVYTGIVVMLLFLNPILSLVGLEGKIAEEISEDLFEIEMAQMETDLIEIEEEQKAKWEERYKEIMEEQE